MKLATVLALAMCCTVALACRQQTPRSQRRPLSWSGWIEEAAAQRGHIKPGDLAQFGCPPGWLGVEDTAAALRGRHVSTVYMGADPLPYEGTITCVAQAEFALPQPEVRREADNRPMRRPLAPVWVEIGVDSTTIGFRSELGPGSPIYIGQDTPCGPRVIGVRLGDLLRWLVDPQAATTRDFLGMVSGGCPEEITPRQ